MVGCYLLATRSLFGRYSIATLIFNEFGGGFLGERPGAEMDLAAKTAPVASTRPSGVAPAHSTLGCRTCH
jgi:hypothetical protein